MTTDDTMTTLITADDPVVKAMQEINRAFFSAAQRFGVSAAIEGLANILVINLAAGYGAEVAMSTLGDIAKNATPIARIWGAVARAADHEPGHA
ncbi:MAG: hypothetical protein JO282_14405 [Alphaproteobacteria bacterium]|nr:hypothetical protein [Alphaproteobacteria bacterium]